LSKNCQFSNYWWETGNPSFLIEKLKEKPYFLPNLEEAETGQETLNAFDVDEIDIVALLWQTGYLTFDKKIHLGEETFYKMKVPNIEIQSSLNFLFLDYLTNLKNRRVRHKIDAKQAIAKGEIEKLEDVFKALFASIPNNNYISERIAKVEGYYASVVYAFVRGLGYDTITEDATCTGRIDLTIKTDDAIIIIEFKVDSSDEAAISQIKTKQYHKKYLTDGREIYLMGMNFDSKARNISNFALEKI